MSNFQEIIAWAMPIGFIVGGFLLGLLINKFVLARLEAAAERTQWAGDDIALNAIRGNVIIWFTLIGMYAALYRLPTDENIQSWLQKLLLVLVILSVTMAVARVAAKLVTTYTNRVEGISTSIFTNLTRSLIFVVGVLVILQSLDISVTPILTALGVGGLAVALALQDTLANLFAGLQILASHQIRPGDFVRLETGDEGYIADISWRNTAIRTLPNNMIIVPNSKMASSIVTNCHRPGKELSVSLMVGVSYDSDLRKVERITTEVAKDVLEEVEGGIPEFDPAIRYQTLGESSITFKVIMRGREFRDQFLLKHELIKRLHEKYREEGIEMPTSVSMLYLQGSKDSAEGRAAEDIDEFQYQESSRRH
jgi:small-conductance mechanosensitive channel